ncbi:MAG: MBL fold metallo-hydrolase [Candidatus Hydrothermarchaeota archaeon]
MTRRREPDRGEGIFSWMRMDEPPEEKWKRIEEEIAEEEGKTWVKLTDLDANLADPFFSYIWFLEGYEESSNMYLIEGDYLTLVDTGNDIYAFFELFELGFKAEDIKKIFLTHAHNDHTLGLMELMTRYGTFKDFEVIVHNSMSTGLLPRAIEQMARGGKVTGVDTGDTVNLSGLDFKVIYTPGHTQDCICLYHEKTQTLFSGDTVLSFGLPTPDERIGGNLQDYLFSLRILLEVDVKHLLPGHGFPEFFTGKNDVMGTYHGVILSLIPEGSTWTEGAMELMKKNLPHEAIFCLNKALEKDANNIQALGLKGSCLTEIGRNEEAIECFDKILEIRKDEGAFYSKGMALIKLKRHEEALESFDEALKINPSFEEANVGKGIALMELGREEEAMKIEAFKKAFELSKDFTSK